ncbi:MAG: LamG domain-containing protein, partial [Spirochaetota bacterium]
MNRTSRGLLMVGIGVVLSSVFNAAGLKAADNDIALSYEGAAWVKGKFGGALQFDGSSGCIDCGDQKQLSLTGALTLEAWVKRSGRTPYSVIIGKGKDKTYQIDTGSSGTGVRFVLIGAFVNFEAPDVIPEGTWVHIAAAYDGKNTARIYVNGKEVKTQTIDKAKGEVKDVRVSLGIGYNGESGGFFNGAIDEVRITKKCLNSFELEKVPAADADTVLLLHFDEGGGIVLKNAALGSADAAADAHNSRYDGPTLYSMPAGQPVFDGYQLKIDGQPVPIYACRVSAVPFNQWFPGYQRPLEQTELAGFSYWDMNGSVKIEVTSQQSVTDVVVRPLSLGIKPNVDGNKISFELNSIAPVTVEVNGYHNALHLFPNPAQKDVPKGKIFFCNTYQCNYCSPIQDKVRVIQSPNMIYFGPGVHDVGILQLKSGDTVYIAGGAVVYGCFIGFNATNIRVYGRGILDGSRIERNDQRGIGGFGCLYFRNCSKITIEGIV